ncbi:MAG: hypothetical protein JEZ06_09425 [Anaerolineaceae bacterium]|nr:hypothetical protein [Anaerolineaceae bacterium]
MINRLSETAPFSINQKLDQLEVLTGKIGIQNQQDAQMILHLLDDLFPLQNDLQSPAMSAEHAQLVYIESTLKKNSDKFIKEIGGIAALKRLRQSENVAPEQWWWFLDEFQSQKRKSAFRRIGIRAGITFTVISTLIIIYQVFFALDPETRKSIDLKNDADILISEGDFAGALDKVQMALQYTPESKILHTLNGALLKEMGQNQEAQTSFQTALDLFADREQFLIQLGLIHFRMNKADSLFEDAKAILEENPDSADGYFYLGEAYSIMDQYENALAAFETADKLALEQGNAEMVVSIRYRIAFIKQSPLNDLMMP